MKQMVVVGVVAATLCVGGAGVARELAAGEDQSDIVGLNADKRALEAADAALDHANKEIAADPDKLEAIIKSKAADHESHLADLASKPEAAQPWPTGIFADPEAPAPGTTFLGSNRWVGSVDGAYLAIYAGRSGADPTVGRIIAIWSDGRSGYTLDKEGTGALTVVDERGSVLTLRDTNGKSHALNATAGKWVE